MRGRQPLRTFCALGLVALAIVVGARGARAEQMLSEAEAVAVLRSRLVSDRVYPHIGADCLYFERDDVSPSAIRFTVRYDQAKCGGDSVSTLLDRFVVNRQDASILWWYVPEDRHYPYERFLAFMHCIDACPTSESPNSYRCYESCRPN